MNPLLTTTATLGLVVACTLRCLRTHIQHQQGPYKDADGEATEESESRAAQPHALTSHVVNVLPLTGLASSVLDARRPAQSPSWSRNPFDWSGPILWALLIIHVIALSHAKAVNQKYKHSVSAAVSTTAMLACYGCKWAFADYDLPWPQLVALLVLLLAFLSFPRRPDVFFRGKRILNENGVSVLDWMLFSWGLHPLFARLPETLEFQDVPRLGHSQSVRGIRSRFEAGDQTRALWVQLATVVLGPLTLQWTLVLLDALSEFGTRFALRHLLQCLESDSKRGTWPWVWLILIAISLFGETTCNNWLTWTGHAKLQLPLTSLLQSLLFEKMMRRRADIDSTAHDAKEERTTFNVVDMMLGDTTTIAKTYSEAYHLLVSAFKIILYTIYISRLLGIKTLVAGSVLPAVAILVSRKLSKRYKESQAKQSKAGGRTSNLIHEAIQGLRSIRLSSMESFWKARLSESREHQLDLTWTASLQLEMLNLVANLGPILLTSVTVSLYAYKTGNLRPSVAFTSISLLENLQAVIRQLPGRLSSAYRSRTSFQKVQDYLLQPEQNRSSSSSEVLCLENACLTWPGHETGAVLDKVDLAFPRRQLSLITGKVGSGKSLLLAAVLDEATLHSGRIGKPPVGQSAGPEKELLVSGSTAYVSQPPWIESRTIQDNIVFGYPFNEQRYQKVLTACALDHDLVNLSNGDLTLAGEAGSALSGGQKWRVALARALYSPAETLILEDILAAVDTPTARYICENALAGEMAAGRTILLATHCPEYCLDSAGYLVTLKHGCATGIAKSATYRSRGVKSISEQASSATAQEEMRTETKLSRPQPPKTKPRQKLARGYWRILQVYIHTSGNMWIYLLGILVALGHRLLSGGHSWWLARWTSSQDVLQQKNMAYSILTYVAISMGSAIALTTQSLVFNAIGQVSSRILFTRLIQRIFTARLHWIDETPSGQIIQTLGSDMYAINHRIAPHLIGVLSSLIHITSIFMTSFVSSPNTIFLSVLLFLLYLKVALRSLAVADKLRPLFNTHAYPISNYANSATLGLTTIRAFGKAQVYIDGMQDLIDTSNSTCANLALGLRWQSIRMGLLGTIFVANVAAAMVLNNAEAAATGFTITIALQLRKALVFIIGQVNVARTGFTAIDRVLELADIPSETEEGEEPPDCWPSKGDIEVQDLTVRYSPSLPAVLKAVSFALKPGQRLGVVGRTGAGKTSLMSAMLRFIDTAGGSVRIDSLDISKLRLKRVREAISIIPQDPYLFSGTLRSNLDLYGKHSDITLLSVLRQIQFLSTKDAKGIHASDLDMTIHSGGSNLSHGQRQLVCLARVMLEDACRILVLDEATSAVDGSTDNVIQQAIQDNFPKTTILVVAHRLLTVANFDSILVLSEGNIVESGTPQDLLQKRGMFCDMVNHSGEGDKIRSVIRECKKTTP